MIKCKLYLARTLALYITHCLILYEIISLNYSTKKKKEEEYLNYENQIASSTHQDELNLSREMI